MKSTEAGFGNDYPTAAGLGDTQVLMRFEVRATAPRPPDAPFLIAPILLPAGDPLARINNLTPIAMCSHVAGKGE